ncbi:MAG: formylglycine-generating enzyme family protein [Synergistaceae bacterium]|jgi:formylglycine-generating enzyme required for sulfatase activity|nr:formylglycine-generating enzyme family protein [Synergistaceae bacterium]
MFYKTILFCLLSALCLYARTADAAATEDFVLVRGGTFIMGSPADEPERGQDETQHRVTVNNFYLARSEVTQREYAALMGNNPSESKGENLPVENVTWFDAVRYCNARSEREGLNSAYHYNEHKNYDILKRKAIRGERDVIE